MIKKHLRLRGENVFSVVFMVFLLETPPLARRKLPEILPYEKRYRNTSACAEKTIVKEVDICAPWKHLRLRGENTTYSGDMGSFMETPPLARRKLLVGDTRRLDGGNTSACAEKTDLDYCICRYNWKHLRLRGENYIVALWTIITVETPPLARRKP